MFLEAAAARAAQPLKGGLRAIAYLEPDQGDELERDHGPLAVEEIMDAVGRTVQGQLQPGDLAGRVAARGIALVFERGNARDLEAWLGRMLERVASEAVSVDGAAVRVTCSSGRRR